MFLLLSVGCTSTSSEKKEMKVTFIDTGWGNSAIITTPTNKVVVIDDGGNKDSRVSEYLIKNNLRTIDVLVSTNANPESASGMAGLLHNFTVKLFIYSGALAKNAEFKNMMAQATFKDLNPIDGSRYGIEPVDTDVFLSGASSDVISRGVEDINASSAFDIKYKNVTILFAGRSQSAGAGYLRQKKSYTVVHTPVVWEQTRIVERALSKMQPQYFIISGGNAMGIRSEALAEWASRNNIITLQTEKRGDITLKTNGDTISVSTER